MKLPLIIVNFKTYPSTIGENGLKLAKIIEDVAQETHANFAIAAAAPDIRLLTENTRLPILAQHVDPYPSGRYTGHILPEMIKDAGACGSLINHAERPLNHSEIENAINKSRELGLSSIVCVDSVESARDIAKLKPDVISLEPPELIGTGVSVCKTKSDVISTAVKEIDGVPLLCGAGVSCCEDVKLAIKHGTCGVLLASAITKSENPREVLLNLALGLNGHNGKMKNSD